MKTPLAIKLESVTPNNNATLSSDEANDIRSAALAAQAYINKVAPPDANGNIADPDAATAQQLLSQIV